MSAGVRACPICGSGNATATARCWVCGADLASAAPPSAAAAPAPATTYDASTRTLQMVGWSALLLGLGFTALLIAVELALEWPGMLIPYAVVVLVAFAALGRTAYVQLRKKPGAVEARPTTAAEGAPRTDGGTSTADVLQTVALGVAIAIAVIAGLLLLAVAAMVIFFLICLAMISSSGFH